MDMNINVNMNTRDTLFWIISIVCYWVILSNKGESGWKGIFPVYREYTLARAIGEDGLAKWLLFSGLAAVFAIIGIVFFAVVLGLSSAVMSGALLTDTEAFLSRLLAGSALGVTVLALFTIFILIIYLICYFKVCYRFTKYEGGSGLWMLSWIFFPVAALVYFAFFSPSRRYY